MANPTDDSVHRQSQSGKQAHTQETGDAGLSSKMEHRFYENYRGSPLPIEEKGSCVRPIPKEEADICELPEMSETHPSVFGPESQSVPAEGGFVKPGRLVVVEEINLQPQFPLKDQLDNRKEEDAHEALSGTSAITEADEKEVGGGSCIMDPEMDARKKTAKRPSGIPKRGRKRNCDRTKAAGNNWKYILCFVVAVLGEVPSCKGFPVGTESPADKNVTCFTCKDEDKCLDLQSIYKPDDTLLYERGSEETFPECSGIPPPTPETANNCTVCRDRSIVIIICSEDITDIEAENSGDSLNITKECNQQPTSGLGESGVISNDSPSRGHFGLIAVVVGALVIFMIYSCWKCNRAKNGQQQTAA